MCRFFPPVCCWRAQALLHAMMGIGILALVGKLHKWDESAVFFDGCSLGALFFSLGRSIYIVPLILAHPHVSSLRLILYIV